MNPMSSLGLQRFGADMPAEDIYIFTYVGGEWILSSNLKLIVKINEVTGFSSPRPFVCWPYPLKTDIKGLWTRLGCVGSSQLHGTVVLVRPEQTYSPED